MAKQNNRKIGAKYEQLAVKYLINKGYQIVGRNQYTPYGEIDILAQKEKCFVFCEVKYRSSDVYGDPLEAVDISKQRRISWAAMYIFSHNAYIRELECRFDVIAVYADETICHIENAFEFQG